MYSLEEIVQMRKDYLMPCLGYFYKNPPVFVKGDMQYLYDDKGKKYLDFFAGVSVMNCGHSNPEILNKVIDQMSSLQHLTNVYLTSPVVELAKKLSEVLPGDLHNSFFCMSGSEANEGAMLLARIYTGKRKFIALNNSLHGRTYLTMSATDIPMWRADPYLTDDVYFISSSPDQILLDLEAVLEKDNDIAAFICEPIQGNGGIITPPDWYYTEISRLLKRYGVLFICDEVQTGFARTGTMFAIEQYNVVPDIVTMSKALGNGIPMAAFSTTKEIAASFTSPSASTLGGNPVSSTAALAVLDYISEHNLCDKAKKLGEILYKKLNELKDKYSFVSEVRGKGLMLGMELRDERNEPNASKTDAVLEQLKDDGIILGKNGLHRNVLAFQPPLVIEESDIDFLLERLDYALANA
ncbi:MAG: aspartate aminotransferase family protein [Clostridiales bacterium]|nr:aspartate aminotransferase family protein [Clostridiales bacterium]